MKNRVLDPNISRKNKLVKKHLNTQVDKDSPPLFSLLEFNLCGLCNRRCVFCPRVKPDIFPNVDRHMPVGLYEKIMKELQRINYRGTLLYSAFGEPLLYRNLEAIIEMSRRYCPEARIEIVTNGDLVTREKLSGLFRTGLTTLCISMYDGPEQLAHFKNLKEKANLRDDQVIFRKRWLSKEEHFGITLSNRAGTLEIKDIGVAPLKSPFKKACYYPFYQILVDCDGTVLLCAHDWGRKLIAGNINEHSILEIWNSDILKTVRLSLAGDNRGFSPCNECDARGVLVGQEHFNKWRGYYEPRPS